MAEKGMIIEGKYEILRQIGEGGMSRVYLARDLRLQKRWALKEVKRSGKSSEGTFEASALAEANLLKKLDHPALPRIVDIIENKDFIYVVMDYIEGETLGSVLEKQKKIPESTVIEWALDLCSVLGYLHEQSPPIIYRDMKPDNIMVMNGKRIKLIDFGIAREYKMQNNRDTVCLGTRGYAAPEQFGKGQSDARTDIYCLGVTLYHLLTGKNPCEPPFKIYPIRHWDPSLSPGLEAVLVKCTQLNPADRFENTGQLREALENYEKQDAAYKKRQRKKLRLYNAAVCLTAAFFISGSLSYASENSQNLNKYEQLILKSERAKEKEQSYQYLFEAAELMPEENQAYLMLITLFKEDARFDDSEEEVLKEAVDRYLTAAASSRSYCETAYEIGRLYWYYLGNEDGEIAGKIQSVSWFEDALSTGRLTGEMQQSAEIYKAIGEFYRDITVKINESQDAGIYLEYFENLKVLEELSDYLNSEGERLEALRLIIYSTDTYSGSFITDGVSTEDLSALRTKALWELEDITPVTHRGQALKKELEEYLNNTQEE